jgi:arylsulfatase
MSLSRRHLLASTAATATLAATGSEAQRAAAKPNILVILCDDEGYSDWGCFGSEIPTPNIDALAAGGLKFTKFYNTPKCSPSRSALLTGAYPQQAGLGALEQVYYPQSKGIQGRLLDRVATFAELLKGSGYFTGMAGKWHLGISHGVGPWQRGFDRSCASPQGRMYFPDQTTAVPVNQDIYLDGKLYPISAPEVGKGEWYSADLFVEYIIRYAREAKEKGMPYALYLPFINSHPKVMAPQEDIARFRGRYKAGWDALRQARLQRQKALGILGPEQKLSPRESNTYNWEKLTPQQQDDFDHIMAIYAANVSRMDKAVGTLVDALKSMGEFDNTLILMMCDNGANAEAGPDGEMEAQELPGPDGRPVAQPLGGPHSAVEVGMEWATLSNTPFRYFKNFTYEGGVSTPFIAHWPRGINPSLNGTFVRDMSHLIDVMPTLLEVTGTRYPARYNGHELVPLQGRSFAPRFQGRSLRRAGPLFWEYVGNRAVNDGRWKLVANYKEAWELYDLESDRSETRNLAASQPERVQRMAAQWDAWAARSFVDNWADFPGGRRRPQNWGTDGTPKLPQAMDSSTRW